jgi:thioester reductase-like protein
MSPGNTTETDSLARDFGEAHRSDDEKQPGRGADGAGTLLLTGGTGVLGRVLIREVLDSPDNRILAVVRRSQGTDQEQRLRKIVRDEGVGHEIGPRLEVLTGNLGIANLGLESRRLASLRHEVDWFLHLAALTDLTGDRDHLFRVNVEGTRRVLQLAWDLYRYGRLSRFGYFSTAFVAGSRQDWRAPEDEMCPHPAWANAYEESKYAAESLVREATAAGLPAMIVRASSSVIPRRGELARSTWFTRSFVSSPLECSPLSQAGSLMFCRLCPWTSWRAPLGRSSENQIASATPTI